MTNEQRMLLQGVVRRAEHCRKYAEACLRVDAENGHDVFVAGVAEGGAENLMRTYFLLCGPAFREHMLAWILGKVREDFGMCDLCGKLKVNHTDIVCKECEQQFNEQDRELEILEKMELNEHEPGTPS
jgi:hypothetical protein